MGPIPDKFRDFEKWTDVCFKDRTLLNKLTYVTHWHMVLLGTSAVCAGESCVLGDGVVDVFMALLFPFLPLLPRLILLLLLLLLLGLGLLTVRGVCRRRLGGRGHVQPLGHHAGRELPGADSGSQAVAPV
jgi:hypothetical protein